VKAGDARIGKKLHIGDEEFSVKISSRDTSGTFAVLAGFVSPMGGPPLHRHLYQDEWFYIVEGQFLFEADGRNIHAGPGDTVFLPHGSCHTLQNVGSTVGRTVVTVVPGGLDLFVEEMSAMLPSGVEPDPAKLRGLFQKHGLELLGPPVRQRKAA
jgi:mannose-6-phosphate isomerase-like protein (cupin superfamily)